VRIANGSNGRDRHGGADCSRPAAYVLSLVRPDTVNSLPLIAKEIVPPLKEYKQPVAAQIAAA
jgi:hypothetical protein